MQRERRLHTFHPRPRLLTAAAPASACSGICPATPSVLSQTKSAAPCFCFAMHWAMSLRQKLGLRPRSRNTETRAEVVRSPGDAGKMTAAPLAAPREEYAPRVRNPVCSSASAVRTWPFSSGVRRTRFLPDGDALNVAWMLGSRRGSSVEDRECSRAKFRTPTMRSTSGSTPNTTRHFSIPQRRSSASPSSPPPLPSSLVWRKKKGIPLVFSCPQLVVSQDTLCPLSQKCVG